MPFPFEQTTPYLGFDGQPASTKSRHERVLEEWGLFLARRHMSAETLRAYLQVASAVCARLDARRLFVFDVRRAQWAELEDAVLFPSRADAGGRRLAWAAATRKKNLAAMSALFGWWIEIGEHDLRNPFRQLTRERASVDPLARTLTPDEISTFFRFLESRVNGMSDDNADGHEALMDLLVFSLGYALALRVSDLVGMIASKVQMPTGRPWHVFACGKGQQPGEWTSFVVPEALRPLLGRWMQVRPPVRRVPARRPTATGVRVRFGTAFAMAEAVPTRAVVWTPRDALWVVPSTGVALSERSINRRTKALALAAGLPPARAALVSSHWFRHSRGQDLAEAGVHQRIIMELMRHSSTAITDVYVGVESGTVEALQRNAIVPGLNVQPAAGPSLGYAPDTRDPSLLQRERVPGARAAHGHARTA